MNLRPFSGSRGANRIMTVGAVSASIPIDPSARSIRLVNSGSSICYVRIGQGEQTATSADVAVFGNSEVVLSKGEGEGTLAFISASGTTLQAQTGSGGTVPGYQVVDQLFLTGDGVTQSGQLVDQFGRTVKPVGDAALTRTDWQGTVELSTSPRTNYALQSSLLDLTSKWTLQEVTVTANSLLLPDGTTYLAAVTPSTTSGNHQVYQGYTAASSVPHCLSFIVKPNGYTKIKLYVTGLGSDTVDVVTGSVSSSDILRVNVVPLSNGLYRVWSTTTPPASTSRNYVLRICNASGVGLFAGDGTSGMYVGAAQIEVGSSPTPPIPTTTAPVSVTDYTLGAGGLITLVEVPVVDAQLKWSGIAIHT